MPSLLDKVVGLHMERLLRKQGQWTAVPDEDKENHNDAEPQILDETHAIKDQSTNSGVSAVDELTDVPLTDVPPTTTLLGDAGATSDNQRAADTDKAAKKSKGLLGCLNFIKKEKEGAPNDGLPTAFNNRQSIINRLARKAKKPAVQPTEKPVKLAKKNPFALHAAAWRTNMELLEQLANGADITKRDKAGLTALHYAAWQGSVDAVELLLEKGANVNVADPEGMLPIHFAAWFDRLDVAALLLDKGSQINPPTKGLLWPTTPLIYAAKMGHKQMTALLMDRGAQVEATYKAASSALHEAAWGGHADVVEEMMQRNISHDMSTSKSKYRALHLAAMSGSAEVVAELLKHGAWVDARSQLGRTPLHLACEKGHVAAAAALVAGGADLLAKDRHGFTPLHLAVDNNHVQLAKLLLDKGATPDATDSHGALPLNFAHDPDFFKLLRAVRWYGAASVPSGNNPNSSRYVSAYVPGADADSNKAAAAATTTADAAPAGSSSGPDVAKKRAAAAPTCGCPAASGWIKAHLPHVRSSKAVAGADAAVVQEPAAFTPAPAASAVAHKLSPAGSLSKTSPAGSTRSTESAAAQAAAASLAREAVKAVVARAAAEAAAEEDAVQQPGSFAVQKTREPEISPAVPLDTRGMAPTSPAGLDVYVPEGAGGGCISRGRDSRDDARLLQQIRVALNSAGGTLAAAHQAATAPPVVEDEDVKLEYFLRAPASIGIEAPSKTPSNKNPSPTNDIVQEDIEGDQDKGTAATPAAATLSSTPVIPVSTAANDAATDTHTGADIAFTAAPTAATPAVKAAPKSAAAAASTAAASAKKSKTPASAKRKSKIASASTGAARVMRGN